MLKCWICGHVDVFRFVESKLSFLFFKYKDKIRPLGYSACMSYNFTQQMNLFYWDSDLSVIGSSIIQLNF